MKKSSSHIPKIVKWFDLPAAAGFAAPDVDESMLPHPGEIALLLGESGAGKSTLLRALRDRYLNERKWIDIAATRLPRKPVIDCFPRCSAEEAFNWLSRMGLAEATSMVIEPHQLSDGQRFRLRVALALHRAARCRRGVMLFCDEFAAPLDDITAAVVCAAIRRAISRENTRVSVILATGREQLIPALAPDLVVRCDFGVTEVERSHVEESDTTRVGAHERIPPQSPDSVESRDRRTARFPACAFAARRSRAPRRRKR